MLKTSLIFIGAVIVIALCITAVTSFDYSGVVNEMPNVIESIKTMDKFKLFIIDGMALTAISAFAIVATNDPL